MLHQCNASLAEPLFLTRYIEKAGTGILDMIKLCKLAGVPTPQFRQEGGQFIQALRRPRAARTAQVVRLLEAASGGVRSREELQAAAKMMHREHFRKAYIEPLVAAAWLERTIPHKPTSRLQKYRLGAKGRAWLARRRL